MRLLWIKQYGMAMLRDQNNGNNQGGGGGGNNNQNQNQNQNNNSNQADDKDKKIADLEKQLAEMQKSNQSNNSNQQQSNQDDLAEKARKEKELADKKAAETKDLESALKFTMGSANFLKDNGDYLPESVKNIFELAEKENYGSTVQKANAIKVGVILDFFKIQSNLDLLTPGHKTMLEKFKALTKDGREEKAQEVYEMVFEPTLESLKRDKKAEQMRKGEAPQTDVDKAYKERLMKGSRKHHLGEKNA